MAESMNSFGGDAPNTHVEDFSQHLLDLGSSPSISAEDTMFPFRCLKDVRKRPRIECVVHGPATFCGKHLYVEYCSQCATACPLCEPADERRTRPEPEKRVFKMSRTRAAREQ